MNSQKQAAFAEPTSVRSSRKAGRRTMTAVAVIVVSGSAFLVPGAAASSAGPAYAWGQGTFGQLGDGCLFANLPSQISLGPPVPNVALPQCPNSTSAKLVGNLGVGGLAPLTNVVEVAAGRDHGLALISDGSVRAWGRNSEGQLGSGIPTHSVSPSPNISYPVTVMTASGPLAGVTELATGGGGHSLALKSDGSVWSWGFNDHGQLGTGTLCDPLTALGCSSFLAARVSLPAGSTATSIGAGASHSLALLSDGTVMSWGANFHGQLGNGCSLPCVDSISPISVSSFGGSLTATNIATGEFHSLAVLSDGTVRAWGGNFAGQLGNGCSIPCTNSSSPVTVSGLGSGLSATAVAGGGDHSLALMSDGTVRAWGWNSNGQLGNASTTSSSSPVTVASFGSGITATKIDGGYWHSIALMSDNTVRTWGANFHGQLGNASTTASSSPVTVLLGTSSGTTTLTGMTDISAGYGHSLAH